MKSISLLLNETLTDQAFLEDDRVVVPLEIFCASIGAEVSPVPGSDFPAVCKGDLCIPLTDSDIVKVEGEPLLRLDAIAGTLGFETRIHDDRIEVKMIEDVSGLGSGQTPPAFTLPDLFTGKSVSSADFLGRKTVFYLWASW